MQHTSHGSDSRLEKEYRQCQRLILEIQGQLQLLESGNPPSHVPTN